MTQDQFPKVYEFFGGDEYQSSVLINKYLLRDDEGNFVEDSPQQVIERVCKFLSEHTEDPEYWYKEFFKAVNEFKGVCPQGSILAAAGNNFFIQSLSNCFVIESPNDSIGGIFRAAEQEAQLMKRRGGVGLDISNLRPLDAPVKNAARTSSGAVGWMDNFSNVCRSIGQCLHEDTKVLTKRGLVFIKEVLPFKDEVWTENGWVEVQGKVKNLKKTYRVSGKYGNDLICSLDHVLHTIHGQKPLKDLKEGDDITLIYGKGWSGQYKKLKIPEYELHPYNNSNRLENIKLPEYLDEDFAYILGLVYGDGYVGQQKNGNDNSISVALSKDHPNIIEKFSTNVEKVFNRNISLREGGGECYKADIHSRILLEFLKCNDLLKGKAHELAFPNLILESPITVVGSFISGYFDADGSVKPRKKSFNFDSVDKCFLGNVHQILFANGIVSKMHRTDRSKQGWRDIYRLSINGHTSQKLFRELCSESIKVSESPNWKKIRDFTRTVYTVKNFNTSSNRHSYIIDNNQLITYSTSKRLCEDLNIKSDRFTLISDTITDVSLYEEESVVYDLILPNTHLFYANGFYVHNSGRRGALMITIDIKHPDAENFALAKQDLKYCTGANVSLKISDEFMQAVRDNKKYIQQWPIDSDNPKIVKEINARDLWKVICQCAWKTAEPGIIFWDNAVKTLPADYYPYFKSVSTNPCITEDAWVMTDGGPRQVKDLKNRSFLSRVNGVDYLSTDSGFFHTGKKDIYLLKTEDGYEIETTINHKFKKIELSRYSKRAVWSSLQELKPGDYISLSNDRGSSWGGYGCKYKGWLLGSLKGDGNICEKTANLDYWGENRFELLKYAVNCLQKSGLDYRSDLGKGIGQPEFNRIRLGSKSLMKLAEELGMTRENNKTLDNLIEKTSSDFHIGFIKGWLDADGSVQGNHKKGISIRLGSIDLDGLKIIQRMLGRLGIISTIYENRKEAGYRPLPDGKGGLAEYYCQSNHELVISKDNIFEYYDLIGFEDANKQEKLCNLIKSYKRKPNRERFVSKIKSIEFNGIKDVYDCTIPEVSSYVSNRLESHNCSEIVLSPNDSCRLTTICLTNYVKNKFQDDCHFDWEFFQKDIRTAMRMMDTVVDAEIFQIEKILSKLEKDGEKDTTEYKLWEKIADTGRRGRRTGLGTHGLADCLAQLQLKYDSNKALEQIEKIYSTLCHTAYDESVEMAKEKGAFPEWDWEQEKDCPFFDHFPKELLNKMKKHGRRNISILTNAPTGSISTLSGTSSGLEPSFRLCYIRRRKVNPNDLDARVDFEDEVGDKWQNYLMFDKNVKRYLEVTGTTLPDSVDNDEKLMKHLPNYFVTSDKIDWKKRITIQSTMQKYIDHSISSTINLPEDVPEKVVRDLYMKGWEEGLKGVTVYRDNCRSGVLLTKESQKEEEVRPSSIKRQDAPQRPSILPCDVHIVRVDGEEYVVIVGLMGPSVYEVFAGSHNNHLPKKKFSGRIEKKGRKKYILSYVHDNYIYEVDINKYFENKEYAAITRLISTSLRHGTPLEFLIDQLNKSSDYLLGFEKSIARVLKKYVSGEDMAKTVKCCEKCESKEIDVRFEEGCATVTCHSCGYLDAKCN